MGNEYWPGMANLPAPTRPTPPTPTRQCQVNPRPISVVAVASIENGTAYAAFTAAGRDIQTCAVPASVADSSDLPPGEYKYVGWRGSAGQCRTAPGRHTFRGIGW